MSYILCSPRDGKGSFFIHLNEEENDVEIFEQIFDESHLHGLETIMVSTLPIRKDENGIFVGSSKYLPTKECKHVDEMISIIKNIEGYYDLEKYFAGKEQEEMADLLIDRGNGFYAEHYISAEESEAQREFNKYLKSLEDKY